jgi:hypothetical protein
MNAHIFNACLLIGWLLASAGGVMLNVGAGLVGGGLLLLVIVLLVARIAGVYLPKPKEGDE